MKSNNGVTPKSRTLYSQKPRIFISPHSLDEPPYGRITKSRIGSRYTVPWTKTKHHRKFIKRHGQFLNQGVLADADIFFWGEYEPETSCTIINQKTPKAVHDELTPVRGTTIPPGVLNTDPYVFGEHFKHICCNIRNRKFQPGDVILFGKVCKVKQQHFLSLDTVFVVKEKVLINPSLNMTQYYKASIEPLNNKKEYFYRGVNYATNNKYYSFVPCLLKYPPTSSQVTMPLLNLTSLGFDVKRGWYGFVAKTIQFSAGRWKKIIESVIKQGWLIGTHIDKV